MLLLFCHWQLSLLPALVLAGILLFQLPPTLDCIDDGKKAGGDDGGGQSAVIVASTKCKGMSRQKCQWLKKHQGQLVAGAVMGVAAVQAAIGRRKDLHFWDDRKEPHGAKKSPPVQDYEDVDGHYDAKFEHSHSPQFGLQKELTNVLQKDEDVKLSILSAIVALLLFLCILLTVTLCVLQLCPGSSGSVSEEGGCHQEAPAQPARPLKAVFLQPLLPPPPHPGHESSRLPVPPSSQLPSGGGRVQLPAPARAGAPALPPAGPRAQNLPAPPPPQLGLNVAGPGSSASSPQSSNWSGGARLDDGYSSSDSDGDRKMQILANY